MGVLLTSAIIVILLLISFLLNFYRDPERKTPKGSNIASPADGKIIQILKVKQNKENSKIKINKGVLGKITTLTKDIAKECYVVSVFMSPFDIHINRAPIEGRIERLFEDFFVPVYKFIIGRYHYGN